MAAETLLKTLKHVWTTLEPLQLPMAVMGGLALAAWRHVRATRDVDILLSTLGVDIASLLTPLRVAGLHPRHQGSLVPLGSLELLQLRYEPPGAYVELHIDLLLVHSEYHQKALARRKPLHLEAVDLDLYVLACEDLILHKLEAGRIIDRADVVALLRANRSDLDLSYLRKWSGQLNLDAALAEVWKEAFPQEQQKGISS
jgi:hypothetical protein